MEPEEIKKIRIGTILTWIPTGGKFRVTGFNEFHINDGTAKTVTGLDCEPDGIANVPPMPNVYKLSKSKF